MSPASRVPAFRGVDYDTGTRYGPGVDSRPDWSSRLAREHVRVIRDDLSANAVTVFGSDPERLATVVELAVESGLHVWVQPRVPDAGPARTLEHLVHVARTVEPLRRAGGDVRLNVGCELSVFMRGLLPGRTFQARAARLRWLWPALPVVHARPDRFLARAVDAARREFSGELTYGAGSWERVGWRRFDMIGLNHYRDRTSAATYTETLHALRAHGLPLLVTEFGCCTFVGADDAGPEGDAVVDWHHPDGPAVRPGTVRDEDTQARHVAEVHDVLVDAAVDGMFAFEYSEPLLERRDDPGRDLDVGSFALVAVRLRETPHGPRYDEEPKAAFGALGARYRDDAVRAALAPSRS